MCLIRTHLTSLSTYERRTFSCDKRRFLRTSCCTQHIVITDKQYCEAYILMRLRLQLKDTIKEKSYRLKQFSHKYLNIFAFDIFAILFSNLLLSSPRSVAMYSTYSIKTVHLKKLEISLTELSQRKSTFRDIT